MTMDKLFEKITTLYQTIDIYTSLIVYDRFHEKMMKSLFEKLTRHDFPIYIIDNIRFIDIDYLEKNYRMFAISNALYDEYLIKKHFDLSTTTVFFILGNDNIVDSFGSKTLNMQKNLHIIKA